MSKNNDWVNKLLESLERSWEGHRKTSTYYVNKATLEKMLSGKSDAVVVASNKAVSTKADPAKGRTAGNGKGRTPPNGKPTAAKGKANTAPKSRPMPGGRSVHADEPQKEVVWHGTDAGKRRVACVKAMRALGAISPTSARTATEIANKMGKVGDIDMRERVDLVKIMLDIYRTGELLHNGFAEGIREAGEREKKYYLTKAGQKTTFPEKSASKE